MCRRLLFLVSVVVLVGLPGSALGGDKASNPSPGNGEVCVDPNTILSWTPGDGAELHHLFLSIDYDDVNDRSMLAYMGSQTPNSYNPGGLPGVCTTYYWAVDEVNGPYYWAGDVWSFTTDGCPCVDPPEGLIAWWPLDWPQIGEDPLPAHTTVLRLVRERCRLSQGL